MTEIIPTFLALPSRRIAPRKAVFRQGAPADSIFLLVTGRVRLVRHLASGHTVTLHQVRAGELFAEGALVAETYHCDAVAQTACEVKACAKSDLRRALDAEPGLAVTLLERVIRQLHHARAMLELHNIRRAEDRVLQHLRLSASADGAAVVFGRPLTTVASEIGLTHEAYYRSLARLETRGSITRNGKTIRLLPARKANADWRP